MKRRKFIQLSATFAALAPLAYSCKQQHKPIAGSIIGASSNIGHLIRNGKFDAPIVTAVVDVAIVGGGISGLSAARWLLKNGISDFTVLDLEKKMGGNAAYGQNDVSAYPWGAHYVPIPNEGLNEYNDFLVECGVVTGFDDKGLPILNEFYLCQDPQERLFINGQWQDGLIPHFGVPEKDKKEIQQFLHIMQEYRLAKGKDGKDAFAIPIDSSSNDVDFTNLDTMSMKDWLFSKQLKSAYLHWYVNYCTRDDFGTPYNIVSAWAGIHYFAGRKGKAANADYHDVLTWPNGNGWLSEQLQNPLQQHLQNNALVIKVFEKENKVVIHYFDVNTKQVKAIQANHCIMATPQFVNNRLLVDNTERKEIVHKELSYAPWMVANIIVGKLTDKTGAPLSWDNVLYESKSLGYVTATHQLLQQNKTINNLTYYLPLNELQPTDARRDAQKMSHADWVNLILEDLKKVHPNIEKVVSNIDVMIWGHAMAQPVSGIIHGGVRKKLQASIGNIHFAHTDLAGISIFEEAFYQGINAAKKVIATKN